ANSQNAKKSTGPRTEKGKARCRMNALYHGLAITLPKGEKVLDELDKHSLVPIRKRLRHIDRERAKAMKLVDEVIETTTQDQVERAVRRLSNLERYSARAIRL